MFETFVAALSLLVCGLLLLRQFLPSGRRRRIDDGVRKAWDGLRMRLRSLRHRGNVRRKAEEVTARARNPSGKAGPGWQRQGNVYRPSAFTSRPPPPPEQRH